MGFLIKDNGVTNCMDIPGNVVSKVKQDAGTHSNVAHILDRGQMDAVLAQSLVEITN